MEQFLTANDNKIDIAFVENDGMAGGAIAALAAQGLAGSVPVSGQDGDLPALNRVALGTQTVDVWKDARELGKAAGEAALALCEDPDIKKVAGVVQFASPGGNDMTSIFLDADPDHQGQPERRARRRLDRPGDAVQGRSGGFRRGLRLNTAPS